MWIEPKIAPQRDSLNWPPEPIATPTPQAKEFVRELARQLATLGYVGRDCLNIPNHVRLRAVMAARAAVDARKLEAARDAIDACYAEASAKVERRLAVIAGSAACIDLLAATSPTGGSGQASAPSAATTVAASLDASQRRPVEPPSDTSEAPDNPTWVPAFLQRPGPPKNVERMRS